MQPERFFASDNAASVHPRVIEALARVNQGHALSYGDDDVTRGAVDAMRKMLGADVEVFFVYNGTAANVLGLQSMISSYNGIICSTVAHINEDECGAPERFTGAKLLSVKTRDGRLTVDGIRHYIADLGNEHRSQPAVISITQSTEMGTVYSPELVREIASYAHENGLYLHVDGARISNAAVFLQREIREITAELGVDVLSFGGTKNGLMFGEAVVFFRPELARAFKFIRKQGMQLASKMRFVAAQFDVYIREELWKTNATHANRMAQLLVEEVAKVPGISIEYPVEANGVFARLPNKWVEPLRALHPFHDWEYPTHEETVVRWMSSFDTSEQDIEALAADLRRVGERGR